MTVVKICGLTSEDAVQAVAAAKADYAGFVYFPPSPRHLPPARVAQLKTLLPRPVKSVSVLVDPDDALLHEIHAVVDPDCLQLHGRETPERTRGIKRMFPNLVIIKAIAVSSADDVAQGLRYAKAADMLLFDARPPENMPPGGTGLSFDWALLKGRQFSLPWFLSGGLNADNVGAAIRATGARMVDVSSSLESAPGVKNPALIEAFVKAAQAK